MAYKQAADALADENTDLEKLLDCWEALILDRGYLVASVAIGRRREAEADILRLLTLGVMLKGRILALHRRESIFVKTLYYLILNYAILLERTTRGR